MLFFSADEGRKRIGIVGSRRRNSEEDYQSLENVFLRIYQKGDIIVSGGCPKGGDNFAERIAKKFGISILIHYPRKGADGKWEHKGSGMVRNTWIAEDSTHLIAVVASDRTGGTEDTIKKFEKKTNKKAILV